MVVIARYYLIILALAFMGCQDRPAVAPVFHDTGKPQALSEWNIFDIQKSRLTLTDQVIPYDLNTGLFTDYAHKLRTVWIPQGTQAAYHESETFEFPVGTIISKTFYYPTANDSGGQDMSVLKTPDNTAALLVEGFDLNTVKLIETRLLVRRDEHWTALSYVWNEAETEAILKRTGDIQKLTLIEDGEMPKNFAYVVPNENQCAGCHATNATTRDIHPIGPKARHLNKDYYYKSGFHNQLKAWSDQNILDGAPDPSTVFASADWKESDKGSNLNHRARSYLDINCAHCHNSAGPADTSGLLLDINDPTGPSLGTCKPPIAAGNGTGDRKFGIVPGKPDESIFTYRLASTDPAVMMPELGRSLAHDKGVALIQDWIASMDGRCEG